jgi:transposase
MPPMPNTDSETEEPPVETQETITATGHARRKYQTRTTEELREKLIDEHLNQNIPVKVICQRHSLSDSTVREIIRRFKNEKRTAYKPRGGARITKLNSNHAMHIVQLMDAEDDNNILSLDDIRENLLFSFPEDFEALVCPISCHAISRHLTEHALISLKRTRPPPPVDASTIATLSTAALTSPSLSTLQLPEHPDHEQDLNEYVTTLKSMGASYLENCIFVGQTRYTAYMLPGRSRSRKGKSVNPLKKAKRSVGFVVLGAFDTNGVRLQARMEKACAQDANMMEFMKEILDQETEPKNIIMSDAFNNTALTDLILQSKHKRIFLPSSLSYTLDPTDALFTHLPSFVDRQTLAENERLLDRVVLARHQIPNESCAAWINACSLLLNQG